MRFHLLLSLGVFVVGCSAASDVASDTSQTEPVIGGTETLERTDVGIVNFDWGSYCTATLIAPRVAITASHCVEWRARDATGNYGNFRIDDASGGSQWFTVDRYRAFIHDGLGAPDVALLRLDTAVPANVAKPAPLATSKPSNGTNLTLYGYGCNDNWTDQTGGGTKRKIGYQWGAVLRDTLCPGDSGGPVRIDSTGAVLLINSGWTDNGWGDKHDVFGEVPQYVARIQAQEAAWSAPDPTHGLTAEYFDTKDFSGEAKVTRVDGTVNFDWGNGSPDAIIENDSFAARWTGSVTAPTSDAYTVEVYSDDGVRLYVDDVLMVDNWVDHSPASNSAILSFTAGQAKSIRLEYYENSGGATAKLFWSSSTTGRQIIPASALTP